MEIVCQRIALEGGSEGKFPVVISIRVMYILNHLILGGEPLGKTRMRVAMYYNNRDVRVEEIPTPQVGPGELLVKVLASGICGSDVMEWYRIKKAPRVLGHEITGEIVEAGKEVKNYKVGDRVFVSHHVPWRASGGACRHRACDCRRSARS